MKRDKRDYMDGFEKGLIEAHQNALSFVIEQIEEAIERDDIQKIVFGKYVLVKPFNVEIRKPKEKEQISPQQEQGQQ